MKLETPRNKNRDNVSEETEEEILSETKKQIVNETPIS